MTFKKVLARIAVRDIEVEQWYSKLLGTKPDRVPMANDTEWDT